MTTTATLTAWLEHAGARGVRVERTLSIELSEPALAEPAHPAPAEPAAQLRHAALALAGTAAPTPQPERLASAVWRGLLSGDWALLDTFDHDDHWYVVARQRADDERRPQMTERERQVAALAARGHANKHIGYELGLSASTVATHLRRGLAKLGVRSRTALVATAPVAALAAGAPPVDELTMDR